MIMGEGTLSEQVYNQILIRITEGIWNDGDKLPSENELAAMFDVSRITVRSAIKRLQAENLVITKAGIGSFVTIPEKIENEREEIISSIHGESFLSFFEFRSAIEFKAMDLFILRYTEEDLKIIEEALQGMEDAGEDRDEFSKHDYILHMAIIKGSKNKFLYQTMLRYRDVFQHYISEINRLSHKSNAERLKEHRDLIKYLTHEDPLKAKDWLYRDNMDYHKLIFKNIKPL